MIDVVGTDEDHFYTCCDNRGQTCDERTYPGTPELCGPGGRPPKEPWGEFDKQGTDFCCRGNCKQQGYCSSRCNGAQIKLRFNLCVWGICFRECCEKAAQSQDPPDADGVIEVDFEFCGDGSCQPGETNSTCIIDCCQGSECTRDFKCSICEGEGSGGEGNYTISASNAEFNVGEDRDENNIGEDKRSFGAGIHIHPALLVIPAVLVICYNYF